MTANGAIVSAFAERQRQRKLFAAMARADFALRDRELCGHPSKLVVNCATDVPGDST